jgi:hypothetical protein
MVGESGAEVSVRGCTVYIAKQESCVRRSETAVLVMLLTAEAAVLLCGDRRATKRSNIFYGSPFARLKPFFVAS